MGDSHQANATIEIFECTPEYYEDFKRLNYEWIEKYFTLEGPDLQYLNYPYETILKLGGHIFMARYQGNIVGTCALIKIDDQTCELAKMAVTERVQGRGIGKQLAQAVIAQARDMGAKVIRLESDTVLDVAIKLYEKLGFREVDEQPSPYSQRGDIQMELQLKEPEF